VAALTEPRYFGIGVLLFYACGMNSGGGSALTGNVYALLCGEARNCKTSFASLAPPPNGSNFV
ncbi:MAG: hypothetical protein K2O46_04885, partial [Bacteroidales bacterium]|nr:hypothetical protein [Bacteroidales bacterium]